MGKDPVSRVLLRLAVPAMVSLFFQNLYTLVDTIFVSWVSTASLAALSLSVPVGYVALALTRAVGVGATALMSHAEGGGRGSEAASLARAALPLMMLVLAPLLVLAVPGASHAVYRALGASGDVLDEAYRYAVWMALGFPVMGYVTVCESIFMSHGDAKSPMQAMIAGNLFNLVLDPLLIFGLGLGIQGASLATLGGWLLSAGILRWRLGRRGLVRPGIAFGGDTLALWRRIASLGGLVFLSLLVAPVSIAVINRLLAGFGPAAVGAWSVMSRTELMVVLPMVGLSNALVPFMGHNLGRHDKRRIREGMFRALGIGVGLMTVAGAAVFIFIDPILSVFRLEPDVFVLARFALRLSALAYPLVAVEMVFLGMTQGLKRPKYALMVNGLRMLVARVPMAFVFSAYWGSRGVFVSHPAAIYLGTALTAVLIGRLLRTLDTTKPLPAAAPGGVS